MIVCPACEYTIEGRPVMNFTSPYNGRNYKLYHCRRCALEFWSPLELIPEFYESEFMDDYKEIHENRRELGYHMRLFFEHMPKKGGKLLDIGCGSGAFLKEAERHGFEVFGIELDAKSVNACRLQGLDNIFNYTLNAFLEDHPEMEHQFDVITFYEVLEHQDKPHQFMEDVGRLLKPDGHIVLSIPNRVRIASYMLRMLSNVMSLAKIYFLSKHDFPPHHLTWWSGGVLKNFLKNNDYSQVKIVPIGLDYHKRVFYLKSVIQKISGCAGIKNAENWLVTKAIISVAAINPYGFSLNLYCQALHRASIKGGGR